jgi:rare lipoprotein A
LGSDSRIIRRASLNETKGSNSGNLIDDGTLWREQGSSATWQQTGMASWYGGARWQGQRTTSGSRYDQNALTAAHATLPLGTKVRVTTHNGTRSVIVTINDRPGTRTRIIDLSREAAKELGMLSSGVAMVTLQPM